MWTTFDVCGIIIMQLSPRGLNMELEKELKFYKSQYKELLSHYENQFVLIKGGKLLGSFTTDLEAYKAGLEQVGNKPFLIKRVVKGKEIDRAPALVLGLLNANL
jgi:phytoene dehydrogenase-like protein